MKTVLSEEENRQLEIIANILTMVKMTAGDIMDDTEAFEGVDAEVSGKVRKQAAYIKSVSKRANATLEAILEDRYDGREHDLLNFNKKEW